MSVAKPSTHFGDKSAPEHGRAALDGMLTQVITLLVVFAVSPIGLVVAFLWYSVAFMKARWSWRFIGAFTLIYTALFALIGGLGPSSVHRYATPWRQLIHHGKTPVGTVVSANLGHWLLDQVGLSILMGSLLGTALSGWRWYRRPRWEDWTRAPSPLDRYRMHRTRNAIRSDTDGPQDGITIGTEAFGHRVSQTDAEGAAHTLVVGGSGSGKTTTMLVGMRDIIRRGHALVVIDLKGGPDIPNQLAEWAARYNRRFHHWSITDPRTTYDGPASSPSFYDPMGRGDPSRRKDLFIGSQKWDVEYYKGVVGNYLQIALTVAAYVPNDDPRVSAIEDLATLLTPPALLQRALRLLPQAEPTDSAIPEPIMTGRKWAEQVEQDFATRIPLITDEHKQKTAQAVWHTISGLDKSEQELSAIRNAYARLQTLTGSTAGAWLRRDPTGQNDIDLGTVARQGDVVVFSLDSSNYKETSAQLAGLAIQDLSTLTSELRNDPAPHPIHVYVDEFSAVANDNVLDLLARARDARMPVTISTQALADLKRANPNFVDQALAIVNCFAIHRANTEDDAETFAGLTGKEKTYRQHMQVNVSSGWLPGSMGSGAATGQGMIAEIEDYRVPGSRIQDLERGQLVYIANSPDKRVLCPINVVKEDLTAVTQAQVKRHSRGAGKTAPTTTPATPVAEPDTLPATAQQSDVEPEPDASPAPSVWPSASERTTDPARHRRQLIDPAVLRGDDATLPGLSPVAPQRHDTPITPTPQLHDTPITPTPQPARHAADPWDDLALTPTSASSGRATAPWMDGAYAADEFGVPLPVHDPFAYTPSAARNDQDDSPFSAQTHEDVAVWHHRETGEIGEPITETGNHADN